MSSSPPSAPTSGLSRQHLLLAGAAVLLIGIGMGVFLSQVSKTPRSSSGTPAAKQEEEPAHGDPVSPPVEPKKEPALTLADFGELLPAPVFPQIEKPTTPIPPAIPRAENKPETPPQTKIESKPTPMPPVVAPEPQRIHWKLRTGDVFYQDLIVSQKPTFSVQGLVMNSLLQYNVVSRFVVEQAGAGGATVTQRVEGAKLITADSLTQGLILPALAKMPGTTFKIQLGPDMSVQRFVGGGGKMLVGGGALPGGFGLQTASLLDQDGWRELAQATFFQPAPTLMPRTQWVKPMSHNWGPLGGWVGQTLYVYSGKQGALHQFTYGHRMNYVAPRGGGGTGLVQIGGAAFQPQEAVGSIVFDSERGRVVSGQEKFRVVGRLTIVLLGQPSPVDIEEEQTFQFRIIEQPSK